jgi:hypothetical protein
LGLPSLSAIVLHNQSGLRHQLDLCRLAEERQEMAALPKIASTYMVRDRRIG